MTAAENTPAPAGNVSLNAPFLPDEDYIRFLNRHTGRISTCHYSLYDFKIADGRFKSRQISRTELLERLGQCRIVRKYALLNARFQKGGRYLSLPDLQHVIELLQTLLDNNAITGIVFSDAYLLNALSDTSPAVAAELEAVPSINFMMDSMDKIIPVLDAVGATHFKLPGKLPLDRALNRAPQKLTTTVNDVARYRAGFEIELLVNEGCLYQCPFKLTHDSLIALLNTGAHVDTLAVNRDLGCMRSLARTPWRILASPFIRPEDVSRLAPEIDLIKICGRTLGPGFLTNTVDAYLRGSYTGNLFELLDACNWMADAVDLPNHKLPDHFHEQVAACPKNCMTCNACREIWKQSAQVKPFAIPPMGQQKKPEG